MEKLNANHKAPKQAKANKKKKPVRVVYISNPVRVEASPAEFRAVVQELTGRDSDIAERSAFLSTVAPRTSMSSLAPPEQPYVGDYGSVNLLFYDQEGYNSQLIEDLPRFPPPPECYNSQLSEDLPWFPPPPECYNSQLSEDLPRFPLSEDLPRFPPPLGAYYY